MYASTNIQSPKSSQTLNTQTRNASTSQTVSVLFWPQGVWVSVKPSAGQQAGQSGRNKGKSLENEPSPFHMGSTLYIWGM